ncbi:hypothetical protein LPJ66_003082 [Kickxella alabastrina]|uniref:Uncharacterized protein n=1 Tax=Kickxella alabastrina TaxID=61397 RepID=A0ACC1IMT1_9FUNG|nr:hypothetical protein LPJ66_003082 [Kickxella alabastrina]
MATGTLSADHAYSMNSAGVRPPMAAHFNNLQTEEDKIEYLPPYHPPVKPLTTEPPAYTEDVGRN